MNNQKRNQEKTFDARSNKQTSRNEQDNKPKKQICDQATPSETDCYCSPVQESRCHPGSGNGKKAGVEYAKVKV